MSLEAYDRYRQQHKSEVQAHRRLRSVYLGEHITLQFEDELTVRYQVQEMLRIERIFEEDAIRHELDAYNPLVPDGGNWKATMMIEYPEVEQRRRMLAQLKGVEDCVWVQVGERSRLFAVADEDLERENEEKTSSVHFLRFELDPAARRALREGAPLRAGIDHPAYRAETRVGGETRAALLNDLA